MPPENIKKNAKDIYERLKTKLTNFEDIKLLNDALKIAYYIDCDLY